MERTEVKQTYTEQVYWENYYRNTAVHAERSAKIAGEYDEFWDKLISSCADKPQTIIEIGAYPGRYLAYLSSRYGLRPAALDYNSDFTKIEDCFRMFEISEYELIQADFLHHQPEKQYDLVISMGFAEHFENYDQVLDKHCRYLKKGGAMLIMIPNKRYLKKYYSYILDRENLKMHNLKIMKLSVFRKFALRNNLETTYLGYYGGFNYSSHADLGPVQKLIQGIFRQIFRKLNPHIKKHPNRFFSSSMVSIYRKN